jgi:hypothetical protein
VIEQQQLFSILPVVDAGVHCGAALDTQKTSCADTQWQTTCLLTRKTHRGKAPKIQWISILPRQRLRRGLLKRMLASKKEKVDENLYVL